MQIHTFNTGALYTRFGQRIAFCLLPDGNVAFLDRDRGIDGIIQMNNLSNHLLRTEGLARLEGFVHTRYLRNDYSCGLYQHHDVERALRAACDAMPLLKEAR